MERITITTQKDLHSVHRTIEMLLLSYSAYEKTPTVDNTAASQPSQRWFRYKHHNIQVPNVLKTLLSLFGHDLEILQGVLCCLRMRLVRRLSHAVTNRNRHRRQLHQALALSCWTKITGTFTLSKFCSLSISTNLWHWFLQGVCVRENFFCIDWERFRRRLYSFAVSERKMGWSTFIVQMLTTLADFLNIHVRNFKSLLFRDFLKHLTEVGGWSI